MSLNPKLLRIFYAGTEQRLKVFDGTDEKTIIQAAKKAFKIDADDSRIFLQDEDGDLVVIPPVLPNELKLFLYVEPEKCPKPVLLPPSTDLLPGFKWDGTVSKYDGPPNISNNGYTLGKESAGSGWTPVVSTETYSHRKLYCKLIMVPHIYQNIGVCPPEYDGKNYYVKVMEVLLSVICGVNIMN